MWCKTIVSSITPRPPPKWPPLWPTEYNKNSRNSLARTSSSLIEKERISDGKLTVSSNDTFMNATLVIAENVLDAVDSVMTCSPNYLVMGMSAITFYGGIKGAEKFKLNTEINQKNIFDQKNLRTDIIISRAFKPSQLTLSQYLPINQTCP